MPDKPRSSSLAERLINFPDDGDFTAAEENDLNELFRVAAEQENVEPEPPMSSASTPDSGYSFLKSPEHKMKKPATFDPDFVPLVDCSKSSIKKCKSQKKKSKKNKEKEEKDEVGPFLKKLYVAAEAGGKKRQNRILLEILLQKLSTESAIPPTSFRKMVRDIFEKNHSHMKIRASAIEALQLEAELMLTKMFRLGSFGTEHAKRQTMMVEDLRLVGNILVANNDGCKFVSS